MGPFKTSHSILYAAGGAIDNEDVLQIIVKTKGKTFAIQETSHLR